MSYFPKTALMVDYYVVDKEGQTVWEGGNPARAIEAYRAAPTDSRVLIAGWDTDGIETIPTGQALDVTALIGAVRGGWVW